jgi:hypothetical protein
MQWSVQRRNRIRREQYVGPGAAECAFEPGKIDGLAVQPLVSARG